ncbi:MAG TPA: hypothetical protein VFX30_12730 [bacterium]|nr:hypothetical protein [bacterium]
MFRIPPVLAATGLQALETASAVAQRVQTGLECNMALSVFRGLVETTSPSVSIGAGQIFKTLSDCKTAILRSEAYRSLYFSQFPELFEHPMGERLLELVLQPTVEGPDGFPRISQTAFRSFVNEVPHLFVNGQELLGWFSNLESALERRPGLDDETRASVGRAADAFRTMTFTAAVTAPPDLWLMRQILGTYTATDVLDLLARGETLSSGDARILELDPNQFSFDAQFLEARGILNKVGDGYVRSRTSPYRFDESLNLDPAFRTDLAGVLAAGFSENVLPKEDALVQRWLRLPPAGRAHHPCAAWMASPHETEVGYRIVPIVLGLKAAGLLKGLGAGSAFPETRWGGAVRHVLNEAGFLDGSRVTALGARAFERGPGVYGIVGAYHPYLAQHLALLQEKGRRPWVERGKNIAASRDANRKSFKDAVEILWDYQRASGVRYRNVLEHAMGLAVGIQEFRKKFGDDGIRYFGADFEQAAIDGASSELQAGRLPSGMKFTQSDIGKPGELIDFLRREEALGPGTVMLVGNGFHEARGKTDEDMIATLRRYRDAGMIVVFTEESGLTGPQIRDAGWNSYHAGFRWTHQVSGQGLRAPWPMDPPGDRLSWVEVFEKAGYRVPKQFRRGTRAVFPCPLPEERNPPISVTFLCLP